MEKLLQGIAFKYFIDFENQHNETVIFSEIKNPDILTIILPVYDEKINIAGIDQKISDRRIEVKLIYSDEYNIMKMQSEIDNMVKKYGVDKIKTYLGYTDTDNIKLKGANNNGKK